VARAEIVEVGAPAGSGRFAVVRVGDGFARALAWLATQPPGRREIVVRSAFPVGSITATDVSAVPSAVGLRFERTAALPPARTLRSTPILSAVAASTVTIDREIELTGARTSVRDLGVTTVPSPAIEIVDSADQRTADAVLRSVLAERVRAPHANRAVQVVFAGASTGQPRQPPAPIRVAWMADAATCVARDLAARGWIDLPLVFGASSDRLIVVASARAADPVAPAIVRSVIKSVADPIEQPAQEIATIADEQLRQWGRAPGPAAPPRRETIDVDDRRWLWGAVLVLLAIESWLRRPRTSRVGSSTDASREEVSRVA
jgi:hypothetical protein